MILVICKGSMGELVTKTFTDMVTFRSWFNSPDCEWQEDFFDAPTAESVESFVAETLIVFEVEEYPTRIVPEVRMRPVVVW